MIAGREAIASVENAMRGMRSDETRLNTVMDSISETAIRLRSGKAAAFKELATLRLDAILADPIRGNLDRAESQAITIVEDGKRKAAELLRQRSEAQEELNQALAARAAISDEVETASDAIDDCRTKTQSELQEQDAWKRFAGPLEAAEAIADQAEKKAAQAEADLETKRVPYETDPLFHYLWQRKFGTAGYQASNLTKMIDTWVARLCGFQSARPNYVMLTEIPKRLREHARMREVETVAHRTALENHERNALVANGIEEKEQALKASRARLVAAEKRLSETEARLKGLDAQISTYKGALNDPALAQAIDVLAQALAQQDLQALHNAALATPTPEDERILAHLIELDRKLDETEAELSKTRDTIREIARRRGELESARDEARREGYDQPYSAFGNEGIIAEVIAGIVRGALRSNDLGRVLKDGFSRRAPKSDPSFGGSGSWPFPDFGGRSSTSRINIRRFPSKSSGGFRTGGSF